MKKRIFTYLMLVCFPFLLFSQWSNNPAENTLIMDTIVEQILPKVVVNADNGESYISWFSNFGGNQYDVYMQRLDVNGNKLWAEDGLLISNHTTMTWVTDYDLVIDNDGCAVLVTQDKRTGYSNVFAYRISPDGEFLWGDDGIALTNDTDFNPQPRAVVTQDGNIVFAFESDPEDTTQFNKIHLQKLSPEGQFLWDNNVTISNDTMDLMLPYFHQLMQSEDNSTITVWVETVFKDTAAIGIWPDMYPYAQKIDSDGNFVWQNKVAIDTLHKMRLKPFMPSVVSDGNSGFFIGWMAYPCQDSYYTCYVQHINSDGVAQWTPNGVNVSDLTQYQHAEPSLTYLPQNDEIFVFWREWRRYSSTDIQNAIFGQKFSNTGERLWTDEGEMFDGWYSWSDTLTYNTGICPVTDNDFILFFENEYWELVNDTVRTITNIHAMRINHEGNFVWDNEKPVISSAYSKKSRMVFSDLVYNQWIIVWADNRNNPLTSWKSGIYAQNISIDGNLGPLGIKENNKFTANTLLNYPNPFSQNTTIEYKLQNPGNVNISLLNLQGQFVKNIYEGNKSTGTHTLQFDGSDLKQGIYFIKLVSENNVIYKKIISAK